MPTRKLVRPAMREVPIAWEKELAEYSPVTDRFTWLKLVWEQGYPWEPVERYMIYQMTPARAMVSALQTAILEQLQMPLPPSKMGNYYDTQKEEFVRNPDCLITERAWHLYQETQCWGRPYWVIQGENGGHKRWWSPVEKGMAKLAGLPPDPPEPGSLCYAPFDERVMDHLRARDLMKAIQSTLRRKKSVLHGAHNEAYLAEEREFRALLVKSLVNQVTEAGERVMKALMRLDAPRVDQDPGKMQEQQEIGEANFIKHGRSYGGLTLID